MKADLHMHGPIGLQPCWLRMQGYSGKNLLRLVAENCFARDIGICAITSDETEIQEGSLHDRLGYLKNRFARELETQGYRVGCLGENILIVEQGEQRVYLINGQTVGAIHHGSQVDHLIVGTNQVPNERDLGETLKWIQGETESISITKVPELISIAEHPLCTAHEGIGEKALEEFAPNYDLIEGHNSQLIFQRPLAIISPFSSYARELNHQTQKIARRLGKNWIATSDAHRIEDVGRSYISFDEKRLNLKSEGEFVKSLREILLEGNFVSTCEYEPVGAWMQWVGIYLLGTKLKLDK